MAVTKRRKGFAVMDQQLQREIASKGGTAGRKGGEVKKGRTPRR